MNDYLSTHLHTTNLVRIWFHKNRCILFLKYLQIIINHNIFLNSYLKIDRVIAATVLTTRGDPEDWKCRQPSLAFRRANRAANNGKMPPRERERER